MKKGQNEAYELGKYSQGEKKDNEEMLLLYNRTESFFVALWWEPHILTVDLMAEKEEKMWRCIALHSFWKDSQCQGASWGF